MRNTQHSDVIRSDNALPNLNIGADPLALTVKNRNTQNGQINKRIMLEKMLPTIGLPASNRTENGVKSDDLEGLAGFTQETSIQ